MIQMDMHVGTNKIAETNIKTNKRREFMSNFIAISPTKVVIKVATSNRKIKNVPMFFQLAGETSQLTAAHVAAPKKKKNRHAVPQEIHLHI